MKLLKHRSWVFLQKKLTTFSQKALSLVNPTTPPPATINTSPKSTDLMQNTSPLFNKPLPHTLLAPL